MSPAQYEALQVFKHSFDAGTKYLAEHRALDGWTEKEYDTMRSNHANNFRIRTVEALRRLGYIRHVGDGFHMITPAGRKAL